MNGKSSTCCVCHRTITRDDPGRTDVYGWMIGAEFGAYRGRSVRWVARVGQCHAECRSGLRPDQTLDPKVTPLWPADRLPVPPLRQ